VQKKEYKDFIQKIIRKDRCLDLFKDSMINTELISSGDSEWVYYKVTRLKILDKVRRIKKLIKSRLING
jgi:hypothetical protein